MSNEVQREIDHFIVFDYFSFRVFEKCLEHFQFYIDVWRDNGKRSAILNTSNCFDGT